MKLGKSTKGYVLLNTLDFRQYHATRNDMVYTTDSTSYKQLYHHNMHIIRMYMYMYM